MGNKYEYVKLTDKKHLNEVVRCQGAKWERYVAGGWIQTGILMEYFSDESPLYEMYEEISEKEALELIKAS